MTTNRVTGVYVEVDAAAGANAKRRASGVYVEVDGGAGANAKRRASAVYLEIDIGYRGATGAALTRAPMWGRF